MLRQKYKGNGGRFGRGRSKSHEILFIRNLLEQLPIALLVVDIINI